MADVETDVLVVGSGAAGLTAAVTAAHAGLRVLVAEKTGYFGGSTAVSGGYAWIPCHPHMPGPDSLSAAERFLGNILGDRMRPQFIAAFLEAGPKMVSFLEANSEVRFAPTQVPDYHSELDGAAVGRSLAAAPFDGKRLGRYFNLLRPPIPEFLAYGGMMVSAKEIDALLRSRRRVHAIAELARLSAHYLFDRLRYPRGTRLLLGNALAGSLLLSAIEKGVDLRLRTKVERLLLDQGRIVGATLSTPEATMTVHVAHAVVLAGGGAAHDKELRAANVAHAEVHRSAAPDCSTGDGLRLGLAVGGALATGNANGAFLAPVSVRERSDGSATVFPHLTLDRQRPGVIAVDSSGRRFTNEANSYHQFVEGMYGRNPTTRAIPAYLICDSRSLRRFGLGMARPGPRAHRALIASGYLRKASSIAELAQAIGVPAEALASTVHKYNACAAGGRDPEFGKGSTAYNRYLGDPENLPNPCLGEVATPPFFAVEIWPGDIGTTTGLLTDAQARVLNAAGAPIPGLYACGNDMNSVMAGHYPAGGITLGPALTFGYVAGSHIAAQMRASART